MRRVKNVVYTIEEYMEQGFTAEEAPLVRKTDIMHNRWDDLTDKEKDRYTAMINWLGL